MKAYLIRPQIGLFDRHTAQGEDVIAMIVEITVKCLLSDSDGFYGSVVWKNAGAEPHDPIDEDSAEPTLILHESREKLSDWIRLAVDPNKSGGWDVRSLSNCRMVSFGYDGQVFLCLRHEDEKPESPDTAMVAVEERPDLLTKSDYFDGWGGPKRKTL